MSLPLREDVMPPLVTKGVGGFGAVARTGDGLIEDGGRPQRQTRERAMARQALHEKYSTSAVLAAGAMTTESAETREAAQRGTR